MFCNCACKSWIDLSSLAMRDFNSSTESFSDCTWPEAVSSLPLIASVCAVDLLLQRVHGRGHLVGVVRGLLRQALQHAEARVQGRLDALHIVHQLLHLRLQFDDLLRRGVRRHGRGDNNQCGECRRQNTIAKCVSSLHDSPVKQLSVVSSQLSVVESPASAGLSTQTSDRASG